MASDGAVAIRREAVRLFAARGYDATSMRDIAKAVGLLPGSLYAHIDSKEQLLLEIVETGIDDFLSAVPSSAGVGLSASERLRVAVRSHMGVISRELERTGVVFFQWRSLRGSDRDRVVAKRQEYERRFVDIVSDGIGEGSFSETLDSRFAVLVILGALNWAPEWFSPTGGMGPDEIGDRVCAILLAGFVADPPSIRA